MKVLKVKNHRLKIGKLSYARAYLRQRYLLYKKAIIGLSGEENMEMMELTEFLVDCDCHENLRNYKFTGIFIKPITLTFYQSGDGRIFDNKEECEQHERKYDRSVDWMAKYNELNEKLSVASNDEFEKGIKDYYDSVPDELKKQFEE